MQKKVLLLFFVLLNHTHFSFSQKTDSTKSISHFSGTVSVTNNGISLVPNFSLGKPAAIFITSLGKNKFSIDPELRFSLAGKPWTFLFWARYKLVTTDKFRMNIGTHLGLNFKTASMPINNDTNEVTTVRRYLAAEFVPNYFIAKNVSVGIYYLYSRGIDPATVKNTNFITINTSISNIRITNQFLIRFTPQFYYLKQDKRDGFYFTSSLNLAKRNFPLSVSSIINKSIQSDIAGDKNFNWNLSLVYSFNKNYVRL